MRFKHWSLKTKLFTLIGFISFASIAFLFTLAFISTKAIREGNEDLIKSTASSLMDKIDRNLFERYGDVQAFALSEPARSGNAERITAFMYDMMGAYAPIYDIMMVVNAAGRVIAVNNVDKTGKPLVSEGLLGKDYSSELWFKVAMSGDIKPGMSFVQDLHFDDDVAKTLKNSGKVMSFTAPIRGANGAVIGVWTNRVSWPDVIEAIAKEESDKIKNESIKEVFTYIVDKNGTYMLHPLPEFELKKKMDDFAFLDKENAKIRHIDLKLANFSDQVTEVTAPSRGYATYPSQGWQTIMQVPDADPDAFINLVIICVSIALMCLVSLIAYLVIRQSTKTLDEVNNRLNIEALGMRETAISISQSSQTLAEATTEQAAALQETAASIEEINAMVKKSSENAERSRQVAIVSQDVASKGKETVKEMMSSMEAINESNSNIMAQIEDGNQKISAITSVITEIANKTKVINEIVFQTKLLSFNASVEAARAGEHGKGFAVVAEEVGNLAQMSGNAAKEISDMLNESILKVESIVKETNTNVERLIAVGKVKVEAGARIARQCGVVLEEVVQNVSDVSAMVGEISVATQEQTQGVAEITKAMNQLDQVTHENASTSQQSAQSSDKLSAQADAVFSVVSTLQAVVSGAAKAQAVLKTKSQDALSHLETATTASAEGDEAA